MITHLQGTLARMDASIPAVEVDVGGIRYEVLVPLFLWPELEAVAAAGDPPQPIGLHIHYVATTNQPVPVLVGFLRRAERDFFRKFTTVEGIGPSKAVKAMTVSVSTIARAIEAEDRAALVRLPGLGARGADKIIATLRGRVTAEAAMHDGAIELPVDQEDIRTRRLEEDATEAIIALGFSRAESRRWVADALRDDPDINTVEDLTLLVLRKRGAPPDQG
ncbi:MAG: Holliday junction branch migration protein RuvA [Dehalococcoidia bacterium]